MKESCRLQRKRFLVFTKYFVFRLFVNAVKVRCTLSYSLDELIFFTERLPNLNEFTKRSVIAGHDTKNNCEVTLLGNDIE